MHVLSHLKLNVNAEWECVRVLYKWELKFICKSFGNAILIQVYTILWLQFSYQHDKRLGFQQRHALSYAHQLNVTLRCMQK